MNVNLINNNLYNATCLKQNNNILNYNYFFKKRNY